MTIAVSCFYIYKTKQGLILRSLGENPGAVDALGIHVFRLRYLYTCVGAMLAALGGAYLTMNHLALTKDAPDDMHIVDNFMAAPYVGGDFSSATALDSLRFRAGLLMTIERNRAVGDWKTPAGGWLEFYGAYKGFSLKNMFYCGGKLFPSLDTFGSLLYQGDACYDAHYYDLVELGYSVVSTRNVDLGAELDFHFSPEGFMSCQKISLTITFGSAYPLKFR